MTDSIQPRYAARVRCAALTVVAMKFSPPASVTLPPEVGEATFGRESFIRVSDTTGAPLPEDDLFAGLRS